MSHPKRESNNNYYYNRSRNNFSHHHHHHHHPHHHNNNNSTATDSNRFQVLCHDQVIRLQEVMETDIPIHGRRGTFPTIILNLRDLVKSVKSRLEEEGIAVKDVRLNGGAASYVIGMKEQQQYSDLDLLFGVDFSNPSTLQRLRSSVLDCLKRFLPTHSDKSKFTECAMKEGYVHKMVRVHNPGADSWSLIALGNPSTGAKAIELKFVDKMRRQFEFTVDSFQIILDSLLTFYGVATQPITEHFYPTVVAESVSGSFHEALHHLNNKLIATRNPEEIRGGGLLKYCKLLVERYHPATSMDIAAMERYMCSRFFIDFPDIPSQLNKLESYMSNHFGECDEVKAAYLQTLYDVVASSTVCLMNHERRETLHLIQCLVNKVFADMEMKQSTVQLEAFNSEDWVLDQVFYGTSYFPQAAYMAPSGCMGLGSGPVLTVTSATPTPEELYGPEVVHIEYGSAGEELACS